MKKEEIIQKYGKLTKAQKMAERFYIECAQPNKTIEYENATASILLNAITSQELIILADIKAETKSIGIYPAKEQIEIVFY